MSKSSILIANNVVKHLSTQDDGPMDEAKLKKLVLNFDKKMLKNQELRIKFPDDPRKCVLKHEMACVVCAGTTPQNVNINCVPQKSIPILKM